MALELYGVDICKEHLAHHGILGMKWGVRRYQNKDGTLTAAGKERYEETNSDAQSDNDYEAVLSKAGLSTLYDSPETFEQVSMGKDRPYVSIRHESSDPDAIASDRKWAADVLKKMDYDAIMESVTQEAYDSSSSWIDQDEKQHVNRDKFKNAMVLTNIHMNPDKKTVDLWTDAPDKFYGGHGFEAYNVSAEYINKPWAHHWRLEG